jgi:hypothetical protein
MKLTLQHCVNDILGRLRTAPWGDGEVIKWVVGGVLTV